jgi:undecaprenyl-diphosphatase
VGLELWQAVVLGLVEGITEYLPVSSTGHLIVASSLMGMRDAAAKAAVDDYEVIIQGGAILAVVGLYWPRFVQMLRGLAGKDPAGLKLLTHLFIAFLPAAVIGLALHSKIEEHLFRPVPVAAAFIVGGIAMIALDRWKKTQPEGKGIEDMTARDALVVGLMQCLGMWPGTSRSMVTIVGGYFGGLRVKAAAEFSFLLGTPTLLAATGLALFKNLWHAHKTHGPNLFTTLGVPAAVIGIVVAAVSAAVAIKWLIGFLTRHGLTPFGVYRIIFGAALLLLVTRGLVDIEPKPREPSPPAGAAR